MIDLPFETGVLRLGADGEVALLSKGRVTPLGGDLPYIVFGRLAVRLANPHPGWVLTLTDSRPRGVYLRQGPELLIEDVDEGPAAIPLPDPVRLEWLALLLGFSAAVALPEGYLG